MKLKLHGVVDEVIKLKGIINVTATKPDDSNFKTAGMISPFFYGGRGLYGEITVDDDTLIVSNVNEGENG
jgi:hypothetical protein